MSVDKTFITFDNAFVDVSKEIDTYINGANFAKVTADMSPSEIEQYRRECWNKFQNTLLVPAINRMVSYLPKTKIDTLEPPKKPYPTPDEFSSAKIRTPLSHLEFYATNLYTKVNGKFFSVLNRVLLQLDEKGEVRINAMPYNNDKKIFNVWFYLFLSGLQKLIVPVPKRFYETDSSNPTVRLYRGMPLEKNISNSLWQKPELWENKEEDPDQIEEDHKINYYTSLGFSSYSTKVSVSCIFAISTLEPSDKPPNMIVYEPQGGQISLPSLRVISDQSTEDEYLTFPNQQVMIYYRENGVPLSNTLKETCSTTTGFPPGILMNWIGITDASDMDLRAGITSIKTKSGGRRKNKNKNKRGIKRSAKRSGSHRRRYKKTHKGHKHK
jgi:hypothetical protein